MIALACSFAFADMYSLGSDWYRNLTEAKNRALKEKKPILLFLHSRNCFYCPKLVEEVFPEPSLHKKLKESFVLLTMDGSTDADAIEEEVTDQAPKRFITSMTPAIYFMGPKEEKLAKGGKAHMIIYGFWSVQDMGEWADDALRRFEKLYGEKY
jgi:thioredoxin-related protein